MVRSSRFGDTAPAWRARSQGYFLVPRASTIAARAIAPQERNHMRTILLIILVILILGALPTWPYSAGWGYYPSGGLGLLLLILLILAVMGKL